MAESSPDASGVSQGFDDLLSRGLGDVFGEFTYFLSIDKLFSLSIVARHFANDILWPSLKLLELSDQHTKGLGSLESKVAVHLRSIKSFLAIDFSNTSNPQFVSILQKIGKNLRHLSLNINSCPVDAISVISNSIDHKLLETLKLSTDRAGFYSPAPLFMTPLPNLVTLECKLSPDLTIDKLVPLFGSLRNIHLIGDIATPSVAFPIESLKALISANPSLETIRIDPNSSVLRVTDQPNDWQLFCGEFPSSTDESACTIGISNLKYLIYDGQNMFDTYFMVNRSHDIEISALSSVYSACFGHLSVPDRLKRVESLVKWLGTSWASIRATKKISASVSALLALHHVIMPDAQEFSEQHILIYVYMWFIWTKTPTLPEETQNKCLEPWRQMALKVFQSAGNDNTHHQVLNFNISHKPIGDIRQMLKSDPALYPAVM